ncbi:RNA demethylase ALKBH5-like, partial [Carlito syrichta]|uniref:RNA demethylase ALKBH5-like n=1 Tax=Carlito syrichta TaxID=1868482 RepID=A0A1U7SZY6_CARSF
RPYEGVSFEPCLTTPPTSSEPSYYFVSHRPWKASLQVWTRNPSCVSAFQWGLQSSGKTRLDAPRLETKSLSSSVLPPSYASDRLSGNNRDPALKPKRSHRKADPDAAHRPRILEMDKEENRRSVLMPTHRRRGSFSSENYWRKSYESAEDCSEAAGSPARKVKMRRH